MALCSANDPLLRRFQREAGHLFANSPRTVAGVSGGADSMALMHLLFRSQLVKPTGLLIAHFNHNLRPEAHQEAQFTINAAQALGLTVQCETWSDPPKTGNLPELARLARYEFLLKTAQHFQATHLACGHHLDDLAETFLERLMRGSGPKGLAAMAPTRSLTQDITLIRPLLFARHQELTTWLTLQGVSWHEDPTNQNPHYLRSRIRHQLLPCLGATFNQDPAPKLAQTAQRMANTHIALEWILDQLWPTLNLEMHDSPKSLSLSWKAMHLLPEELSRRALLRCHQQLTGAIHPPGSRATSLFAKLLHSSRHRWHMSMQGVEIHRDHDRLILIQPDQPNKNIR